MNLPFCAHFQIFFKDFRGHSTIRSSNFGLFLAPPPPPIVIICHQLAYPYLNYITVIYTTLTHHLLKQQIREGSFYMYSLKFNLLNTSSDTVSDL
jgi:hypothetical protein